jgi:hypothetical protein
VLVDTVIVQTVAISCHGNQSWHGSVFVQSLVSFDGEFGRDCDAGPLFDAQRETVGVPWPAALGFVSLSMSY